MQLVSIKSLFRNLSEYEGKEVTILGLVGDTSRIDMELLNSLEIVESVKRVTEPFKQANRKFHPQDTIVEAPKPILTRSLPPKTTRPFTTWLPPDTSSRISTWPRPRT